MRLTPTGIKPLELDDDDDDDYANDEIIIRTTLYLGGACTSS